MNKVVILYVDDWAVLYVNGEEKHQGHDIDVERLEDHCPIESITHEWVSSKLIKNGYFPNTLKECSEIDPSLEKLK